MEKGDNKLNSHTTQMLGFELKTLSRRVIIQNQYTSGFFALKKSSQFDEENILKKHGLIIFSLVTNKGL